MTGDHIHGTQPRPDQGHDRGRGGHSWMMIACCIPMLAIAIALVAAGVASPSFLFVAIGCTAMMAVMMRGMDQGAGPDDNSEHSAPPGHGRGW